MAQLTLQKNDQPTFFNKEMLIGLLFTPMSLSGFGAIAGGLIGAFVGKERMEREKRDGKIVSDKPSFWNKDTMLGALIGQTLGGVLAAIAAVTLISPVVTIGVAMSITAGVLGGATIGAYFGGKHGQKNELSEFAHAQLQQQQKEKIRSRESAREQEMEQEKSPAYAAKIDQERSLSSVLQNTR